MAPVAASPFVYPDFTQESKTAQLFQFRLGLFQPVRHPHLAVHRRRGGEMLLRLLALARAPVELAEAEVAWAMRGRMPSSKRAPAPRGSGFAPPSRLRRLPQPAVLSTTSCWAVSQSLLGKHCDP